MNNIKEQGFLGFLLDPKYCISTHGLSGYAPGSYRDGNDIICGMCGIRIKNPQPTGYDSKSKPKFGNVK